MPAKILVVDDEPTASFMIRQIFRKEIRANTYELTFASNGVEALACLAEQDFPLVLSDINMPEMNGLDLIRNIQSSYPNTKVVMVSAYSDMSRIRHCMNYGAFDYITKPIDAKDLKETVAKAFRFMDGDFEPIDD